MTVGLFLRGGSAMSPGPLGTADTVLTGSLNDTAFTELLTFDYVLSRPILVNSFPASLSVSAVTGTVESRYRIQRVVAATVTDSTGYSTVQTGTGITTETLSFAVAPTWAATDSVRLSFEIRRSAGHGNVDATVDVESLDSFVEVGLGISTINAWDGATWVPGGLRIWTGTRWDAAVAQRWNGAAWVDVL